MIRLVNSVTSSRISALHAQLASTHEVVLDLERTTQVQDKAIQQSNRFLQNILRILQEYAKHEGHPGPIALT